TDPFLTFWGICQSLVLLLRQMPDVVFAKGGYGAVPVVIAARLYGIPVLIHESDAVAGMANRLLGKISSRIALAYPHAERYFSSRKTAVVGIPIREEILRGDKERARKRYRLRDDLPTVLVLGGSQGARALNEATVSALPKLLARTQVIHQTGTENYRAVVAAAAKEGIKAGRDRYFPTSFLSAEEMGDALALADIVISRAGAGAIAEIAACQKAAILVPLDISANDHQRMNAYEVAKIGGALVLEEANLGAPMLAGKIFEILDDVRLKTSMEKNISVFFNPRAAEVIADGLSELVSD
ncbi:MAG TPA: UDP-N-acetylglucosamine--N-acetylmuramyl-(pentapeptide) pyrophosphoryl-undecaprenol N-acetylglucosamine transferase, partial [Candidatus Moranbacteria bacterium]|nr:UDP-N-acetylglucosamine--N-acetylmuramyl-(pentapeptide) pyrophosphoryl-undecaprenol N-acetylglucosamine transferase [Candidatus Moranbacteria bacterium]